MPLEELAAFEQQNPLLSKTLNAMHEMAVILDVDRIIVYYNSVYKDFAERHGIDTKLGIRPGAAFSCVRSLEGDEKCGTTDFCSYCGGNNTILKCLNGEKSTSECNIIAINGNEFSLKVSATPLHLNEKYYTLYCIIDVSSENRKKTLEKIFFHDINNIVGGVSLLCEMLADNCDTKNPENISNLQLLRSSVDSLKAEIDSQRLITMAEKDELKVKLQNTHLINVLDNVVRFFRSGMSGTGISIVNEVTDGSVCIETDPVLLKRVIVNVIKNACEASESGQTVTIKCNYAEENIVLSVHNEKHMSEDVCKSVFKRSFSTKGKGRGLGTYSMRLLTERYLKGNIYFTSVEGDGTTFYIELPVKQQG